MKDRIKQYYNAVCKGCGEPTHVPETYKGTFTLCPECRIIHTPTIPELLQASVNNAHLGYVSKSGPLQIPIAVSIKLKS